jgi:hypothetical protein
MNAVRGEKMSMAVLLEWLQARPNYHFVPLFQTSETDLGLKVCIHQSGSGNREILCRNPQMEGALIELVETGCAKGELWQGLFYIMGKKSSLSNFQPMYIGIAEKIGRTTKKISANITNIRTNKNKFARWGDSRYYHIGDLSYALFSSNSDQPATPPSKKYTDWAKALFISSKPPILTEPIFFYVSPWHSDDLGPSATAVELLSLEKELITLAGKDFEHPLLNVQNNRRLL